MGQPTFLIEIVEFRQDCILFERNLVQDGMHI